MSKQTAKQIARAAKAYAKRMEREPSLAANEPAEWDFREVTEGELVAALEYEWRREACRPKLLAWLASDIEGRPVREWLYAELEDEAPDDLFAVSRLPVGVDTMLAEAMAFFPLPWLSIPAEVRRRAKEWKPEPFRAYRLPAGLKLPYPVTQISVGFGLYRIDEIVAAFESWVRDEARKHAPAKRGKASSPPWHKLRTLAALRLHLAVRSHGRAQAIVAEHAGKVRLAAAGDVLPNYASAGAWHDAVKAAEQDVAAAS
jgi:hypothetical protein